MIPNYTKDSHGVVHQININSTMKYDSSYIDNRYKKYPHLCVNMSYLRLGYIIGSIGYIPNSILDVGYGSGEFIQTCKTIIPHCYGNDVTGLPPPAGVEFVKNIFENTYDVITFFDVLEHFEQIDIIQQLKCKYICISVPWCHYFNDEWFLNWKHRRPDEHLHHFDSSSLINFFEFCGFKLINSATNIEDCIRKDGDKNILTGIFKSTKV